MSATADRLASINTPDTVETRLGTLEFDDGAPSEETAALLYDNLDFLRAVQAYLGTIPGASLVALRYEDARAMGLVYGSDRFNLGVQTANGVAHAKRVKLSNVRLGSISLDDVDALVMEEGLLATNLLGMSFLTRLSRYEVRDGMLVLER